MFCEMLGNMFWILSSVVVVQAKMAQFTDIKLILIVMLRPTNISGH